MFRLKTKVHILFCFIFSDSETVEASSGWIPSGLRAVRMGALGILLFGEFIAPAAFPGMWCWHLWHHVEPMATSAPHLGQVTVFLGATTGSTSRPQCLQTFASLRMVSAQKGHFRTLLTLGAGAPIKPTIRSPIGPSNNPPRNHAPALLPFDDAMAAAPMPQTIHIMMYSMFYIPPTLPTPQGSGKVNFHPQKSPCRIRQEVKHGKYNTLLLYSDAW